MCRVHVFQGCSLENIDDDTFKEMLQKDTLLNKTVDVSISSIKFIIIHCSCVNSVQCYVVFYISQDSGFTNEMDKRSLADLWVPMLRFYSIGFDKDNYYISIINKKVGLKSDKGWDGRRLCIQGTLKLFRIIKAISDHCLFCGSCEEVKKFMELLLTNLRIPSKLSFLGDKSKI